MGRTREELLATITARELIEWQVFDSIEPFGDRRADLQAGSIRQAILAVNTKKGKKVPTLQECSLDFEPKKKQTESEIEMMLKSLVIAKGGEIKRGND